MPKPRAWLSWSSGKDSAWALHVVRRRDEIEVVGLLTTVTEPYDRVSMHGVRRELLLAQAKAVGLPLHCVPIPTPCSNQVYEAAMRRALSEAKGRGVRHMIFGDLFLEEIRKYRESRLANTGIQPLFPLWRKPTRQLAQEMIAAGMVAHVTCLDPGKVPRELAGRQFSEEFLAGLPSEVDPCAENGEFHTCVSDGPMFSEPIAVRTGQTAERDGFVFTDLVMQNKAWFKKGSGTVAGTARGVHGTMVPEMVPDPFLSHARNGGKTRGR